VAERIADAIRAAAGRGREEERMEYAIKMYLVLSGGNRAIALAFILKVYPGISEDHPDLLSAYGFNTVVEPEKEAA
jgi:hypothetical protein